MPLAAEIKLPGPPASPKKPAARLVTAELKALMSKTFTIDEGGDPVTYAQEVARRLVNKALGYVETIRGDDGMITKVRHESEVWAFKELLDRYEGKPQPVTDEEAPRLEADSKVMALVRDRVNRLAKIGAAAESVKDDNAD